MSELSASGHLRGRALAQKMRRQQAVRKQTERSRSVPAAAEPKSVPPTMRTESTAVVMSPSIQIENMAQKPSGREAALAHRALRCTGAQCWSNPEERRPRGRRRMASAENNQPVTAVENAEPALIPGVEESFLDSVCEMVDSNPTDFAWRENSVRQLCKARRQTLAQKGKVALTVMRGLSSASARLRYLQNGSGREFARLHRQEQAEHGRGRTQPAQAAGQLRSRKYRAPQKVEADTTLSGSEVTGTQVSRQLSVTGNEAGSCRGITGTEYVGTDQFASFCATRPAANPAKVGVTSTSTRQSVSGTQLGRSTEVTGDEAGTCSAVTGTEYLSMENFGAFCQSELPAHPQKVAMGMSAKQRLPISGSDEARSVAVTGSESGVQQRITGSQYSDAGVARMTINGAPAKVAQTHTFAGEMISGTAVDSSPKITGLDSGECRPVTGTEYLSQETFQSLCRTAAPEPVPAKVGISSTDKGQRITGNLVDRSEKVTGNEPGSCQRVTGTGYALANLCGGGVDKVGMMSSLSGTTLTGTGVSAHPKMSGDERGECLPVTGTEYYGAEHYTACESTPHAEAPKVGLTRTATGLLVSGPVLEPSESVTGNEAGADLPISGTPYSGEPVSSMADISPSSKALPGGDAAVSPATAEPACCSNCALKKQAMAQGVAAPASMATPTSTRFVAPAVPPQPAQMAETRAQAFSIVPPSRQFASRITGNGADQNDRVTGPVNLARGLVTGTPEFRTREAPQNSAPALQPAVAAQAETFAPEAAVPERGAWQITGDDWSRSQRVTGTEGHWAQKRNPTQRGDARICVMSAGVNKGQALSAAVSDSKLTGSSGNSTRGSLVTYSGGARG
ncbi:CsoS2 family carboxysome shell protein [Acidithiobacillus montserratensis]|uniref:CsoS2 family carboxysome shell protein n=1 Tax=Acidithiobacillus montserratensis TaxID=2729135 RepID=A0ACD5HEH2_9PROT|nr:CsoS2 family carboxysome shell protein [Acidithiobacillus montserratensis]MBU2748464.1 carboxysome shell protein [Acidithiobacillus montserratensis]